MSTIPFNSPIFDVVEYIKKLRNAGVSQEVAEIQGQEIEHVINNILRQAKQESKELFDNKELATKKDIDLAIAQLKHDTLKLVVWTGVLSSLFIVSSLSGVLYTLLKLMLHV